MKTVFSTLLFAMVFIMATQPANAKIRRVGYPGTTVTNTDYADLQSAHDAAAANDTLLIYPGNWYATYSKKLVTIGYGYFVDTSANGLGTQANPGLQNIKGSLSFQVNLAAGSSNCTFEGLDGFNIYGDGSGATLTGIIVRRCKGSLGLGQNNNVYSNWQVLQSYLDIIYLEYGNGATISNLTVNNCYIYQLYGNGGIGSNQNGQFNNCTFYSADFNNGSFIIKNSIIANYHSNEVNCVYQYNLFNTDYSGIPSGTGNIGVDGIAMTNDVFVGWGDQGTYSNDGRLALKAGSPAKAKGQGGIDMGIYGGLNPYKLSGIPRVPAIYKLTAPSNTTSGNPYTITLSVRSNN